jgi:hypothetical protein
MTGHLNTPEIAARLKAAADAFTSYCLSLTDKQFFVQPPGKWSAAQQVKHLIAATNTARYAFTLPAFLVRMVGGTPNRPSRTYDELVAKYKLKLQQGGRASGRYVPKPVRPSFGKEKLLKQFTEAMIGFSAAVENNREDPAHDQYLAPHPLLGKITLRELCYFTIYHTWHHLENIRKQLNDPLQG